MPFPAGCACRTWASESNTGRHRQAPPGTLDRERRAQRPRQPRQVCKNTSHRRMLSVLPCSWSIPPASWLACQCSMHDPLPASDKLSGASCKAPYFRWVGISCSCLPHLTKSPLRAPVPEYCLLMSSPWLAQAAKCVQRGQHSKGQAARAAKQVMSLGRTPQSLHVMGATGAAFQILLSSKRDSKLQQFSWTYFPVQDNQLGKLAGWPVRSDRD